MRNTNIHDHRFDEWEEKETMTTQAQVRDAFWLTFFVNGKPREYRGKTQNQLPADIRMAFVDYVEHLQKSGAISETLAGRVTL